MYIYISKYTYSYIYICYIYIYIYDIYIYIHMLYIYIYMISVYHSDLDLRCPARPKVKEWQPARRIHGSGE